MKIEISHDALARKIYERASADDKMRLKVATFIRNRYADYLERRQLLITADLNYIEAYEKDLPKIFAHEPEKLDFVRVSKRRKKIWKLTIIISTVVFILVGFVVTGVIYRYWRRAETAQFIAEKTNGRLQDTIKALNESRSRGQKLLDSLGMSKDRLTEREMALLHVRDSLNSSMKELTKAYAELEKAKQKIEEQSEKKITEISSKASKLESEKRKAEEEKTQIQRTSAQVTTEFAAELARQAAEKLKENKKEDAFKLAAQAYELQPSNAQAEKVLKSIHAELSNRDFTAPTLPLNEIISRYSGKFKYKPKYKR